MPLAACWLALNPALARHLGWQPAPAKLFAWQDEHGALLVESVYWVDGQPEAWSYHPDSEAGASGSAETILTSEA